MSRDNSPKLRNKACDLAAGNWIAAAAVANEIADPWYACQAYAWCGRFAPASESAALIDESFKRARGGKDPYQRLAANAWPLRALIELALSDRAAAEFETISRIATDVQPPSSRAEACYLIFEALAGGPRGLGSRVLNWMLNAVQPNRHWREQRAVRDAVIQAVTIGLIQSGDVLHLVRDERVAAQVAARLAGGERHEPRSFFWKRDKSTPVEASANEPRVEASQARTSGR